MEKNKLLEESEIAEEEESEEIRNDDGMRMNRKE